ncbi:carbohydrate ABC transporter permease [Paenibacillus sp. P32E]|uniref:carbohydrate ABC transporter permease n=1 Tax=Paenibacillus sp. P32E TaxID=1349434 RepID=UPI00093BD647|nr:hypothetical protein A3848_27830 [Paenibacillus sp. P32E]
MNESKRQINAWTSVAPSLILTLIFGVYPIFWALKYMFYDYQGFGEPLFIGLDNFERLFRDKEFWKSVVNTFIYAGGKLLITLPLSSTVH